MCVLRDYCMNYEALSNIVILDKCANIYIFLLYFVSYSKSHLNIVLVCFVYYHGCICAFATIFARKCAIYKMSDFYCIQSSHEIILRYWSFYVGFDTTSIN